MIISMAKSSENYPALSQKIKLQKTYYHTSLNDPFPAKKRSDAKPSRLFGKKHKKMDKTIKMAVSIDYNSL
jgi:hypothetical protein